ncbi:MAG: hypothetical protein JWM32_1213 [Verrucomicrobia bacterium]|nr:hypothetical protein [Verrucomicrobiota bacterium]
MKNLPLISIVASLITFALFPTAVVAVSLLFSVCLIAVFAADYKREIKPLAPAASVVAFPRATRAAEACELAA